MTDIKPLLPEQLQRSEFLAREYLCVVDLTKMSLDDCFRSKTWAPVANKLVKHDIIRIRSTDGAWDFYLKVADKTGSRIRVERYPKLPQFVRDAEKKAAQQLIGGPRA
jgi:hypothetical protein